jgi:acyl-CoA thioester hydrolase
MLRHTTDIAVRFYELDPYDHVNHAVYLSYFETARIEALESVGMGLGSLSERGFHIVVGEINVLFQAPAVAGDILTIETEVLEIKRVTHHWRQQISRPSGPVARLDLRAAMTDLDGRPTRIPGFFSKAVGIG